MTHGPVEGKAGNAAGEPSRWDRRWALVGLGYLAFLVAVDASAYLQWIPVELARVPWFDTVGHFFFIGLAAFMLHRALRRRTWRAGMPIGIALVVALAGLEEGLQFFSVHRTLSLGDFAADLAGIASFWALDAASVRRGALG